ncbi:hypothetical protein XNW1_3150003 [Xenorhabdus nematophila str. Websteri]|nr:hypothetical protein XNA1_500005 [Xenorhabdus nematophila str. Anatoliense]CEE95476.1 hypothetical protein XNA1_5180005 [Xenorhabdus nematophila str. Anatoliense]CEF31139.1 hypothetical protein XNW1_3150003 [Xenorhabdus nematophila str. Websteri]
MFTRYLLSRRFLKSIGHGLNVKFKYTASRSSLQPLLIILGNLFAEITSSSCYNS